MVENYPEVAQGKVRDFSGGYGRYGFLTDAREQRGFIVERIEELLEQGFDLLAVSRIKRGNILSMKIMKKSTEQNGEVFAYAKMYEKNKTFYQFGYFNNIGELESVLNLEGKLKLEAFQETKKVIDAARGEMAYFDNLNLISG